MFQTCGICHETYYRPVSMGGIGHVCRLETRPRDVPASDPRLVSIIGRLEHRINILEIELAKLNPEFSQTLR